MQISLLKGMFSLSLEEHRPTARVLDILELVSSSNKGYTLTEIALAVNSPKSTILPIVRTLCQRKFIMLNKDTSRYIVSVNAFVIGSSYLEDLSILNIIKEEMKSIVNVSSETCQMGILAKGDVLYIAKIDSPEPIRLMSFVGKKIPAYCTAIGKALLSRHTAEQLHLLYPQGLHSFTPQTITSFNRLYEDLQVIRQTNLATEMEEVTANIQCLAVPLCKDDHVIAAISVSIPLFRANPEKLALIEQLLLKTKKKIEPLFANVNLDTLFFSS